MAAGDKTLWADVKYAIAPPQGRLVQQAAGVQSGIASGTATAATFGAGSEEIDSDNFHDTVTNNSRVTPSIAGTYEVWGGVAFAGASDYTSLEVRIRKNGTTNLPPATKLSVSTGTLTQVVSCVPVKVVCNGSTDYFELIFQGTKTAGTVGTVVSSQYATVLEWKRISA